MEQNKDFIGEKLINFIRKIVQEEMYKMMVDKKMVCMNPVIVKRVNSSNNTAQISFPVSPDTISGMSFPNRTGSALTVGSKVYLLHIADNSDQGVLISNKPTRNQ